MKVCIVVASLIVVTSARFSSLFHLTFGVKQGCSNPPPSIANGQAVAFTALQSPVRYQCNAGYDFEGRRYNYCVNGSWTFAIPPKCIKRKGEACGNVPPRPINGRISYFRGGNEASYRCIAGYRLVGHRRVACVNGDWTPNEPPLCVYSFCSRKPCARYASCRNIGVTTYSCTCRKGYVGDGKVQCKRVCEPPRIDPANLFKRHIEFGPKKDKYEEDESITYTCKVGYRPANDDISIYTCVDGHFFNVGINERNATALPSCKPVTCDAPIAPRNGSITPAGSQTWNVGDVVTYFCDEGYLPLGPEQATCQNNGRFDNDQVRCVATCNPPTPPVNGFVEPFERPFFFEGDQVKYFCKNNTVLQGSNVAVCSSEGMFDPQPPMCQLNNETYDEDQSN